MHHSVQMTQTMQALLEAGGSQCLTLRVDAVDTQAAHALLDPYLLRDPDFPSLQQVGDDRRALTVHPRIATLEQLPESVRARARGELGGVFDTRQLGPLSPAQRQRLFTVVFFSKSKASVALAPDLPTSWRQVLSNFYRAELEVAGRRYASVEHYFQAQKAACSNRPEFGQCFELDADGPDAVGPDPTAAKRAGGRAGYKRVGAVLDSAAWVERRVEVMQAALAARWAQQPLFRAVLTSTRGLALLHFERAGAKSFWGGSVRRQDGLAQGENRLGQLLMALRARSLDSRPG